MVKIIRNLLRNQKADDLEPGDVGPTKGDPLLTMTYFTARSNLFLNASKLGISQNDYQKCLTLDK